MGCLRSGITCIQDMVTLYPFDLDHLDTMIEAFEEISIRAVVALQYADIRGIKTIPFGKEVSPRKCTEASPPRLNPTLNLTN